jgi:hypothetical protein
MPPEESPDAKTPANPIKKRIVGRIVPSFLRANYSLFYYMYGKKDYNNA